MATPFQTVYDTFLSKILEDEWSSWSISECNQDWRQLMESAIPWFKFPRVSLERNDSAFSEDLSQEEIQIIATYMKCEWLNRNIMTWENVKPLYIERDFSQANLLDKLKATLELEQSNAAKREATYYRSRNGKPFDFSKLATRTTNDI